MIAFVQNSRSRALGLAAGLAPGSCSLLLAGSAVVMTVRRDIQVVPGEFMELLPTESSTRKRPPPDSSLFEYVIHAGRRAIQLLGDLWAISARLVQADDLVVVQANVERAVLGMRAEDLEVGRIVIRWVVVDVMDNLARGRSRNYAVFKSSHVRVLPDAPHQLDVAAEQLIVTWLDVRR